jgi:hypothetical protein
MSLISLQDHELAIEALDHYLGVLKGKNCEVDSAKVANTQALLSWIKLQYHKGRKNSKAH